jgi:hypothetical protein
MLTRSQSGKVFPRGRGPEPAPNSWAALTAPVLFLRLISIDLTNQRTAEKAETGAHAHRPVARPCHE